MRSSRHVWILALLLPILHFLLRVGLGLGPWAPDLLTVGLLLVAREVKVGVAAGVGFTFGLLEDAFSVLSFGANAMALTVVGILGAKTRDLFLGDSLFFALSYFVMGSWVRIALHWIFAGGAGYRGAFGTLVADAPIAALYAGFAGTLLLAATGIWSKEPGR